MVVGLLGNRSPDSNRLILVTPKSENDVRLQATLGNQNPTGLPVGVVSHGSYIKVNESGTEASAATVVSELGAMWCNFTPRKIKNVIVNSKFSFIIKDDIENQILFMGQIDSLK